jgi:hypothetical protein
VIDRLKQYARKINISREGKNLYNLVSKLCDNRKLADVHKKLEDLILAYKTIKSEIDPFDRYLREEKSYIVLDFKTQFNRAFTTYVESTKEPLNTLDSHIYQTLYQDINIPSDVLTSLEKIFSTENEDTIYHSTAKTFLSAAATLGSEDDWKASINFALVAKDSEIYREVFHLLKTTPATIQKLNAIKEQLKQPNPRSVRAVTPTKLYQEIFYENLNKIYLEQIKDDEAQDVQDTYCSEINKLKMKIEQMQDIRNLSTMKRILELLNFAIRSNSIHCI